MLRTRTPQPPLCPSRRPRLPRPPRRSAAAAAARAPRGGHTDAARGHTLTCPVSRGRRDETCQASTGRGGRGHTLALRRAVQRVACAREPPRGLRRPARPQRRGCTGGRLRSQTRRPGATHPRAPAVAPSRGRSAAGARAGPVPKTDLFAESICFSLTNAVSASGRFQGGRAGAPRCAGGGSPRRSCARPPWPSRSSPGSPGWCFVCRFTIGLFGSCLNHDGSGMSVPKNRLSVQYGHDPLGS